MDEEPVTRTETIDPTKNVLDLVNAAVKRQDDLRDQDKRHAMEMAALRDEHAKEIRGLESKYRDSTREIDVKAVETAYNRALEAIDRASSVLADTVKGITEQIAALQKSSYEGAGKGQGMDKSWAVLVAAVGIFVLLFEFWQMNHATAK